MHHSAVVTAGLVALATFPGALAGFYAKNSPVIQVDSKNYERLIGKSNHTSIVEFYAPWCGHCQNLKPAYEKAAKSLDGLANVAAIDCDEDANKRLCGKFGIKGFPTLKIIRPGQKVGKPAVEDYQGPRTAAGIVEAVVDQINNHVKKVTDQDADSFLADKSSPKALLFTEKGTATALLKSIAIDFLGVVTVGQVRNTQKELVEKFGIKKFPALILIPAGDDAKPIQYEGEMKKKAAMVEFISQAGSPNQPSDDKPDKAERKPQKPKEPSSRKKETKKEEEKKKEEEEPSPEAAPEEPVVEEPTATPAAPAIPPIASIDSSDTLQRECLNSKSHTCVLAIVPTEGGDDASTVLASLAELAHKHLAGGRHLFPFFSVPEQNPSAGLLKKELQLESGVELIAVNARRGWWRHYQGGFDLAGVESWIDAIRMSEGVKKKLPDTLVVEPEAVKEEAPSAEKADDKPSDSSSAGTAADAPEPETEAPSKEQKDVPKEEASETPIKHEEL